MKKNGFTLIELIAVIILIALISTIAIIPINNIIKESKDKLYDHQIEQIILAAQNWASDNEESLITARNNLDIDNDINNYDTIPVITKTLDDLINEEYLDEDVKDIRKETDVIKGCSTIEIYYNKESITANKDTYRYRFVRMENCD